MKSKEKEQLSIFIVGTVDVIAERLNGLWNASIICDTVGIKVSQLILTVKIILI